MIPSYLTLENGTIFRGFSPKWQRGIFSGEVVFTTGMTGYPESISDPSYSGQILVFTYPLIGNYGVPAQKHWESSKIHLKGVVVSETCCNWSHHSGLHSLLEWLKSEQVPIIAGIDTRKLTKILRESGTMIGSISSAPLKEPLPNIKPVHYVADASIVEPKIYGSGNKKVIAVDCGMKENIMRQLTRVPLTVLRVPYNYDFSNDDYDGLFISNGPGDPTACTETIQHLQKAYVRRKPIFGICLGTQLMALAAGAKTYKLPYGHRGQNQPCLELATKKCVITSQNHGYAIVQGSLPQDWQVTFKNLNDGSVEGIAHRSLPYFSVQFHPEACPGPTDTTWLFEKFIKCL